MGITSYAQDTKPKLTTTPKPHAPQPEKSKSTPATKSAPAKASPIIQSIADNMVLIHGGIFTMGCTGEQGSDCGSDEKPAHIVTLNSYYLSKYEVTQAQWRAVMGSNHSYFSNCDNCPVERVSWDDIQGFIKKLNQQSGKIYRLPTEAEWEFAARGGNKSRGYQYSGSNDIDSVAWYNGNSGRKTHPVGQKQSNELGLYDMSGNVWEWCSDKYGEDYYSSSPSTNPRGPSNGENRVIRGGSWYIYNWYCRVSYRFMDTPDIGKFYYGFRLARN
jgi:formylglycine-generating enzyme